MCTGTSALYTCMLVKKSTLISCENCSISAVLLVKRFGFDQSIVEAQKRLHSVRFHWFTNVEDESHLAEREN